MKRFIYPIQGFLILLKKDKNFILHLLFGCIVVLFGMLLNVSRMEWLFLVIAIFAVLFMEVINTSVEFVVDLVTDEYHDLAKYAKDTAAFSVVLASMMSLIIGLIVFVPHIINIIK